MSTLKHSHKEEVFENIRKFYVAAVDYAWKRFPFEDEVLKHAEVADCNLRTVCSFSDVEFFHSRIPNVCSLEELRDAFRRYQTFPLPVAKELRCDEFWHQLHLWKNPVDGCQPYEKLALIMLGILAIPHSNADAERVFSMVRKNRTECRSSMATDTLESVLILKMGGRLQLTTELLKKMQKSNLRLPPILAVG